MSEESNNLLKAMKLLMKCNKCSNLLRSIGYAEDEYGPHEQFVCDFCNPPKMSVM
jgi:hypothetical protein